MHGAQEIPGISGLAELASRLHKGVKMKKEEDLEGLMRTRRVRETKDNESVRAHCEQCSSRVYETAATGTA